MELQRFGRYEIKTELGRGGFGTVYHAFDPRFKREVALKVLPREFLHNPNFKARFEREAQTIATLEHPAIVPVYDFGEENGQSYLVMRYLSGGTLSERLAHGALPLDEVIVIMRRIAPALAEAHEQGIIHRDLKPDNILFDQRNDPYVTDFGLVKVTRGEGGLTSENVIIGTPAYMSPEQARGESGIDGRSDIYALGIILFEMLTGQLPYQAESPVGQLMQHITEPVPRILKVAPNLPSNCEAVISRALAKEADERFSSATELVAALTGSSQQQEPVVQSNAPNVIIAPVPLDLSGASPKILVGADDTSIPPSHYVSSSSNPSIKPVDLRCPNCGASLSGELSHNMPVECDSCGSSLMITLPEQEETMICPRCQTPNSDNIRFCLNCGNRLKIDCTRCHTPNRTDAIHCVNCGANVQSAEIRRREIAENQRKIRQERERIFKEKQARQLEEKLKRLMNELAAPTQHEFVIYQLNQIGEPAISPLINTLLKHDSRNARYGAAKALGKICGNYQIKTLARARGIKGLIKALADSEATVRYNAAKALGTLKGKQAQAAVEPLGTLLKDSDERVRNQVRSSLEQIGGNRAQKLLESSKGFLGWLKG